MHGCSSNIALISIRNDSAAVDDLGQARDVLHLLNTAGGKLHNNHLHPRKEPARALTKAKRKGIIVIAGGNQIVCMHSYQCRDMLDRDGKLTSH